jgi:hypothetical protein
MQTQTSLVPSFVYPISGGPLSVDITTESVETSESGVRNTRSESLVIYRDSVGRLRHDLAHVAPELSQTGAVVQIIDTTRGFMAILVPIARRAFLRTFPAYTTGASSSGVSLFGGPGLALSGEPGKRTVKTEALGKRVIEGIEFEGELTTVTVEGERTLVATDESWFSKELGLFGLRVTTGPGGKTTSRILRLSRNEPDASLFVIPSDYVIQDNASPPPPK